MTANSIAPDESIWNRGRVEALLLCFVLVAAFHAVPYWILFQLLPAQRVLRSLGDEGFANLADLLSLVLPLLLCLGSPHRSGLSLGTWRGRMGSVIGICALPIVLTAIVYPLTAQPFKGDRAGAWLISPLAQELLFTGFIYGRLDASFPGTIHGRLPIRRALLLTAVFFMLWHVPNFEGMGAGYVMFQLAYTLIGGAWGLLARQLTGSILPGVFTHMAVNFVANMGW